MEWLDALSLCDPCLELELSEEELLCFFEDSEERWPLSSDRLCLEEDLDSCDGVLSVELLAERSLRLDFLSFSSEMLLELLVEFLGGRIGEAVTSCSCEGVTSWWRYLIGGRAMPSNRGFGCRVS